MYRQPRSGFVDDCRANARFQADFIARCTALQELQGQADAALTKGDYGQAESLGKQAVAAGSAGFGAVDPNVASSWSGLGSAQLRNNNLIEAENSFRQALTI